MKRHRYSASAEEQFDKETIRARGTAPSWELQESATDQKARMNLAADGVLKFQHDVGTGYVDSVTISPDGEVLVDQSHLTGDGDGWWWTGKQQNSSEALKIGYDNNGNHHWVLIEAIGANDISASRSRAVRWNCRTTKDTAGSATLSACFMVNAEHYTAAATLANCTLFGVYNADVEMMAVGPAGQVRSAGGFHYGGGGTDSCVYGDGAGVDGNEPRCTSIGVDAISYGDDCVAIGYGAIASSSVSTGHQDCVAIGSEATAAVSSSVAIGRSAAADVSGGTAIGANSSVTANNTVAIGTGASCTGAFGVAIGQGTTNLGSGVAIGQGADGYLAIGYNADGSGHSHAIAIGTTALASAAYAIGLGKASRSEYTGAIAIGYGTDTTAANQLVIGSHDTTSARILDVYIGRGVVSSLAEAVTFHATGGSGTDIAGGDLELAGGKGTGNAVGGALIFKTSTAGASGTTLQSLAERARIATSGELQFSDISSTPSTPASGSASVYALAGEMTVLDDAGNETTISPHDTDGPGEIYREQPGIEAVVGYKNYYRAEIRWVNLERSRNAVVETFEEYNLRRASAAGHVDLVQRFRDAEEQQLAEQRAKDEQLQKEQKAEQDRLEAAERQKELEEKQLQKEQRAEKWQTFRDQVQRRNRLPWYLRKALPKAPQ